MNEDEDIKHDSQPEATGQNEVSAITEQTATAVEEDKSSARDDSSEKSDSSESSSKSENSDSKKSPVKDQTSSESEESVTTPEDTIDFFFREKLRSEEVDAALNNDLKLKNLQFSQHEFVKTTEMGSMI